MPTIVEYTYIHGFLAFTPYLHLVSRFGEIVDQKIIIVSHFHKVSNTMLGVPVLDSARRLEESKGQVSTVHIMSLALHEYKLTELTDSIQLAIQLVDRGPGVVLHLGHGFPGGLGGGGGGDVHQGHAGGGGHHNIAEGGGGPGRQGQGPSGGGGGPRPPWRGRWGWLGANTVTKHNKG